MNTLKIIEDMAFGIGESLIENQEYRSVNKEIILLHKEIEEKLPGEVKKLIMKLSDLEAKEQGDCSELLLSGGFLQGIALGRLVRENAIKENNLSKLIEEK